MWTEKVEKWGFEKGYLHNNYLPTICIDVLMSLNGASDPWPDEHVEQTWTYLCERLRKWKDGFEYRAKFDNAIRVLVEETCKLLAHNEVIRRRQVEDERLAKLSVGT